MTASTVFLSYAHRDADKAFVRQLHARLERDGVECFFDETSIAPGGNFVLKINDAINQCNYFVLVMSRAYFDAHFTKAEWTAIVSEDPTNNRGRLLPLLLETCDIPTLLRPFSYIDVSTESKFDHNYPQIIQHLGQPPPSDLKSRLSELDELIDKYEDEKLMKRLLDFACDFAQDRKVINRLTSIKLQFGRISRMESEAMGTTFLARADLVAEGLNLKDGIIAGLTAGISR